MTECPFESDVIDALASRRWPARAGDELLAHVDSCASCRDLAAVASALMNEGETAYAVSRVPSSASVWHRAQMRAREEAARVATRPIGFVQGIAFSCGIAAVIAIAVWGLPFAGSLMPDFKNIVASLRAPSLSMPSAEVATSLLMNTTVQLALAAWALLMPVALYFALSRE